MRNLALIILAVMSIVAPNFAQFTTVTYDLDRNWFNEGQPLPAEKSMIIKAMMPEAVEVAELSILSENRKDVLYVANWQKQADNNLALTVPYKLRASNAYDFRWDFFETLDNAEYANIGTNLKTTLNTYLDVNLAGNKSIKLSKNAKKIVLDLNELTRAAFSPYRTKLIDWNTDFSEVIRLKLEQLEKTDLDGNYSKKEDTTTTVTAVRSATKANLIEELKQQISLEVDQMLNAELLIRTNALIVDNYTTEAKDKSLAVNVGYGGVYLSGEWDDFSYGASPYLGLAFPLGNSVLGNKFLSNTSVTLGVFLNNFEDKAGNEITGLLVNRPMYVGLDHKLFQFIRINAGATLLEGVNEADIDLGIESKNIMVRPFIGLSARIDLSVGLGK